MSGPGNFADPLHRHLIDVVSAIGLHQHLCVIYESEEEQSAAALAFLKAGLERGEKCLYVADEFTVETTLRHAHSLGLNIDDALKNGAFEVLGKRERYVMNGIFDPDSMISSIAFSTDRATAAGYSGLRVLSEMSWALGANLINEYLVEFESKLNTFLASKPATVVCQYNRRLFRPEIILGVLRTHPFVVYGGDVSKNPYYVPPKEFLKAEDPQDELDRLLLNIRVRQVAETELREMRDRFHAAFTYAPVGIVMLTPDGQIVEANQAYASLTGYAHDELRATSIHSLTHPDDLPEYQELWRKLVRGDIPAFVFEKRYATKDGRWLWDRQTVCPAERRKGNDAPALMIAIVEDVDQRRRVELERARLVTVVEKASDFIGICDLDLQVIFVSAAGRKLVGLSSLEEARRTKVTDYFLPADARFVIDTVLPAAMRQGSWSGELRLRHFGTGIAIPVLYEIFPIDDPGTGKPINLATVMRDLTERKGSEQQLQRSFQELRALTSRLQTVTEQERTRLAREIHDELGQALAAVKIDFASFVRDLPLDDRRAAKAESMVTLVNNTIDAVRRISTELRPGILDDLGLVAALDWAAEDFESRTGIRLTKKLPEEIAVDGDRATALFRIFQETLTNVALHSGATEVSVELAEENGIIILQVEDNGRGISDKKLCARESIGILGMRERAALLGGELIVDTAPEKGTTVRVRLPQSGKATGATGR